MNEMMNWIDLPSLTEMRGGWNNFMFIGSVTLESMRMEMIEEQIFLCFHRVDSRSQVTVLNTPTLLSHQVFLWSLSSLDSPDIAALIMSMSTYIPFDASYLVPPNATEFRVANNYFNSNAAISLVLSNHPTCKQVIIGDTSFRKVRQFELSGLPELEGVVIGKNSFTNATTHGDTISYSDTPGGVCRIVNCPKLKTIQIGFGSFSDYHLSFEVTNLQSLQSIQIEDWCFFRTSSFSLTCMNENTNIWYRSSSSPICLRWRRCIWSRLPYSIWG